MTKKDECCIVVNMIASQRNRLNLSPLKRAIDSLRDALEQPKNPYTRDATIQRFEYTFELSWKLLRRYLATETDTEAFNLKELFRIAGRQGIISSVEIWFEFLKARNLTSHTYNEETAEETYLAAQYFLPHAEHLLGELEKRSNAKH